MPYTIGTRDRIEAWPIKGTKKKLIARAKAEGKKLTTFLNDLLHEAAKSTKP